jgi:HEAT repeat protein
MLWFKKQLLRSGPVATRRQAVHALCRPALIPSATVTALFTALDDPDAEVRCVAMTGIGKSEDPRRAEAVRRMLADPDASVRNAAILAAKRLKDPALGSALAPVLQDADFALRGSAAVALEAIGWHPTNDGEEIRLLIARGQLHRVATFGTVAIAPLEQLLATGPVALRPKAVDALSRIDDEKVIKPITAALRSTESPVVVAAADVLGKLGNPDFADALVPLLKHAEALVRTTAVDALGRLGATAHATAMAALLQDKHWDTRRAAADALAKLRDPKTIPALATALKTDPDSDVREACALALGALRDRAAIAPLVLTLNDSASSVRRIAAAALARIDEDWSSSPEAQPALAELKAAEAAKPAGIRVASSGHGLRQKAESGKTPTAVEDPEKNRKHAVNLFTAILTDSDRDLRQAAVEALGRLGGQRAEAALSRALRDADSRVQSAAELALRNFPKSA